MKQKVSKECKWNNNGLIWYDVVKYKDKSNTRTGNLILVTKYKWIAYVVAFLYNASIDRIDNFFINCEKY